MRETLLSKNKRKQLLSVGLPPLLARGFKPSDLFKNGEDGLWFSIADQRTLFQDAAGTTPVTAGGDPVGLVLDKHLGGAGPELVTNGDFSNDISGWISRIGGNSTVQYDEVTQAAVVTMLGIGGGIQTETPIPLEGGRTYLLSFDIWSPANPVGHRIQTVANAGMPTVTYPITGVRARHTLIFTSSGTPLKIELARNTSVLGDVYFDNISVREIPGVPLSQSVLANAFTAVRMPLTGRRNLLTWTEDLTNAVWTKASVTATQEADGWWLLGKSITGQGNISQSIGNVGNDETYAFVAEFKQGTNVSHSMGIYRNSWGAEADTSAVVLSGPGTITRSSGGLWVLSGLHANDVTTVKFTRTTKSGDGGTALDFRIYPGGTGGTAPAGGIRVRFPQLEPGATATPYQRVTNANDVHEDGVPDVWSIVSDYAGDVLSATLPFAIDGEILIAGTGGTIIEPVSYASGSTFNLGTDTYTGGTPGILRAIGPIVGVVLLDRAFTDAEKAQLIDYYKARGAKGQLVEGPELNATGLAGFTLGAGWAVNDGVITRSGQVTGSQISKAIFASVDTTSRSYLFKVDASARSGDFTVAVSSPGIDQTTLPAVGTGTLKAVVGATGNRSNMGLTGVGAATITASSISVRELRPQEDW